MIKAVYNRCLRYNSNKLRTITFDFIFIFTIYHPYYKKELWLTNATYNSYFYYSFNKLRTIASMYHWKAFFDPFYITQTKQFVLNN